jgi:predicted nucleic acid-binding protein
LTVLYADASVIVRAYFEDEPEHEPLRRLLFDQGHRVVSSEIVWLEHAAAVQAAAKAGRIQQSEKFLARFEADWLFNGSLSLIQLRREPELSAARRIVITHGLRTLDAIHVAVALGPGRELGAEEGLVFVTRDQHQADAARAEGLEVA